MIANKSILVLSPHTDDAELGCGASIIKFLSEGCRVLWIVFSTAEESVPENMVKNTLENEFLEVVKKLRLSDDSYKVFHFKVRYLHEKRQDVLELLVKVRNEFKPDLVIGPSLNDFHQDHIVVANEMVRAFKSCSSIICYELPWNNVQFSTQLFIRLTQDQIECKIELLRCYKSQLIKNRPYFSEEYVYGVAKTRGIQINSEYAEAFEVIRWIF